MSLGSPPTTGVSAFKTRAGGKTQGLVGNLRAPSKLVNAKTGLL